MIPAVLFALAATHFLHLKAYWAMHRASGKPQPAAVDALLRTGLRPNRRVTEAA